MNRRRRLRHDTPVEPDGTVSVHLVGTANQDAASAPRVGDEQTEHLIVSDQSAVDDEQVVASVTRAVDTRDEAVELATIVELQDANRHVHRSELRLEAVLTVPRVLVARVCSRAGGTDHQLERSQQRRPPPIGSWPERGTDQRRRDATSWRACSITTSS
jgi:hypothetical protein